ncbi:hypothetical protein NQ315_008858 [Exocentrus adspersus]|uniref:C2H2-type domain-containing protein n=1 Tax=Exocentrus adspersus TaxID=1586481 RepID=A0AAV8VE08_9CUCU|nr:hypothetical protein NQ315_008858 [Exocentrus adspersus]
MSSLNLGPDCYTCITCRVAFKDAELQREHYKTDWHRYNLKRKVAEFPPVTAEEFRQKVLNQRNADEISKQDKSVYCGPCQKSFGNQNAFDNHLNSRKHKENEKNKRTASDDNSSAEQASSKIEIEEEESDIEEVDSDEWDDDTENPIDNNDCLFCMHHSRFMCLWCNEKGKTFHSADAARQHMVDKGHCKMIHEGIALAEYADFYDYSTSYPDVQNEEVDVPEIDDTDYQLVLPSGVTVGHRSLMRYYRQNPNRNAAVVPKSDKKLHKVLAQYRALGWTETQQAAAAKKARDIHYMKRAQAKYNMKMGMKNNSILQKHFRRQVQF